jgi:hypothetical protein
MQQNTPRTAPGVDAVMVEQDALEFQREDLIYGLANPRGEFVQWLKDNNRIDGGTPIFIDQYDIASASRNTAQTLQHDHRFIEALRRRYPDVVQSADNGLDLSNEAEWGGAARPVTHHIAKQKCKGGLDWLMFAPQREDDVRRVHFVVEGLDEHVPAKDHKGRGGDEYKHGTSKHRTITGAELRWVYRHRDASRVSDNILFWRKDPAGWKKCEAPWADAGSPKLIRDSWAAYGGHLMMNDLAGQLSRLQVDVDRMDID